MGILVMARTKCAKEINVLINFTVSASIRYFVLVFEKLSLNIWVSQYKPGFLVELEMKGFFVPLMFTLKSF